MLYIVFVFIILGICSLVFYKVFKQEDFGWNTDTVVPLLIISLTTILVVSFLFNTKYTLSDTHLQYVSGPFKGEIPIESIQKVKTNTTQYVGFKPALAPDGLIIYYNSFDEIYISPDSSESFVKQLLKLNPSIQILN